MSFSSSMRNLSRSRLLLLRTQFERTQIERTQFARAFSTGSKGGSDKDFEKKLKHLADKGLGKDFEEKIKYMVDQGVDVKLVANEDQPSDTCTIRVHPHTWEVTGVWGKQLKILRMLRDLCSLAEVKLTLSKSGLLASLYKHGPRDTWRAVAQRMKAEATDSVHERRTIETWLDEIEPLVKEICTVLIIYQKQKKTNLLPKDGRLEVLPHDFGSILIKLSQLRLKWKTIASLKNATLLDDSEMEEMSEIASLTRNVHRVVVVEQLMQREL